jgi:hypothetical protein
MVMGMQKESQRGRKINTLKVTPQKKIENKQQDAGKRKHFLEKR